MHLISPRVFLNRRQLRVLGVDPSIANCGWGVIEPGQLVGMGIIHTAAGLDEFERYEWIAKELARLIEEHRPEVAVVEQFQHFFRSPTGDAEGDGSPCRSGGSPVLQGGEDVKLPPDAPDAHDDTLALADAAVRRLPPHVLRDTTDALLRAPQAGCATRGPRLASDGTLVC